MGQVDAFHLLDIALNLDVQKYAEEMIDNKTLESFIQEYS